MIMAKKEVLKMDVIQTWSEMWLKGLVMVFSATFNNISTTCISWCSELLVKETGVPRENHRPDASHWKISAHNGVSGTPSHERDSNSQTLVAIGTTCIYIGSFKSNYDTITTMTAPAVKREYRHLLILIRN